MPRFQYTPEIAAAFPTLVGGVILTQVNDNPPASDAVLDLYRREQEVVIARIGSTPLSELPALAAWRAAFRRFGVDPTQYRSAAESLLRRLTKKGDIPSINTLVDLGNLVSIRYALPIAVIDTRAIEGVLSVRFADGGEQFTPLDQAEPEFPEAGEVIFSDEARQVVARRWCWRQSDASAARAATRDLLITIEGHHERADDDVRAAVADLSDLLQSALGASPTTAILRGDTLAV